MPALPATVRTEEEDFAELSRRAPSAAGYYFDKRGELVVLVRDSSDDRAAVTATAALEQVGRIQTNAGKTVARRIARATFTFGELAVPVIQSLMRFSIISRGLPLST